MGELLRLLRETSPLPLGSKELFEIISNAYLDGFKYSDEK
ncbi:hypothetical protein LCGC14_1406720, partial [marine sediment metagenome]